MAVEKSCSKGQAWFCTTGLPSDVIIEVDDMVFHLHKFQLMSKSRKLQELIEEQEKRLAVDCRRRSGEIREENDGGEDDERCYINLPHFPGGSIPFETATKFCYGQKIEISASNAAALRCAAEYLEMTEELCDDNLISMTERFISQSVLRNIKSTLITYASCQNLLPTAENLGIVMRCVEAIATKAASADPSLFGWPLNDDAGASRNERGKLVTGKRGCAADSGSWLDELGRLNLQFFKRLIFAMKALNLSGDVIEICLVHYAKKYIPGISRPGRKTTASSGTAPSEHEQRDLLETIIANWPKEKSHRSTGNLTRFLFGLLRTAYILNASESSRLTVEKKIGSQLEQATLDDLLIPSYYYLNETLYDVDCVERILTHFLHDRENRCAAGVGEDDGENRSAVLMMVGKLMDSYLSEIASDANLKPEKFFHLAAALPYHARIFDDGLYRAVDVYIKAHPWISETEREKICSVLDYQKLTLEACTHAAQNERLPLRAVVQVLFFEQLQLRHAIAGTIATADASDATATPSTDVVEETGKNAAGELALVQQHTENVRRVRERDNQVLRVDMDTMRTRVHELERECTSMKKAIEKMGPPQHVERNGWISRFGCKIRPQVCNSHDRTVVEARKTRAHRNNH